MTIGDLPLAAKIAVAIVAAFVWFGATCFVYGVYLGARDVIAYMRTRAICARHDFQTSTSLANCRAPPIVALDGEPMGGARRAANDRRQIRP